MTQQQVEADRGAAETFAGEEGEWVKRTGPDTSPKLTFAAYRAGVMAIAESDPAILTTIKDLFQPHTNYKTMGAPGGSFELKPIVTLDDANEVLDKEIAKIERGLGERDPAYALCSPAFPDALKAFKAAMNEAMEVSPQRGI